MIVKPSKDVERLNEILNHPSIYPWVHGPDLGPIDAKPVVNNPQATVLLGEYGGIAFYQQQPGLYDFHTFVLPEGRGKWTLKMATDAFYWVYTHTDAMELLGRVPYGNIAVRAFAKNMGGVKDFRIENGWIKDHAIIPADVYSFNIQSWMRTANGLPSVGSWFHRHLDKEYVAMGFMRDHAHPDDEGHDRYVGACIEMVKGGQPFKATVLYNRWAKMAGYQEIHALSENPAVIDIGEAILLFKDNNFKVMSCRSQSSEAP